MQPSDTELEQYSNTDGELMVRQNYTQTSDLSVDEETENYEKTIQFQRPVPKYFEEESCLREHQRVRNKSNTNLIIAKSFPLIKSADNIKTYELSNGLKIINSNFKDKNCPRSDEVSVEDTINVIDGESQDYKTSIQFFNEKNKENNFNDQTVDEYHICSPKNSKVNVVTDTVIVKDNKSRFYSQDLSKICCPCKTKSYPSVKKKQAESSSPISCCNIGTSPKQSLPNTPIYVCTCLTEEEKEDQRQAIVSCSKTLRSIKFAMDEFLSKFYKISNNILPSTKAESSNGDKSTVGNDSQPKTEYDAQNMLENKEIIESFRENDECKPEKADLDDLIKSVDNLAKELANEVYTRTKPIIAHLTESLSSTVLNMKEHLEKKKSEIKEMKNNADNEDNNNSISKFLSQVESSVAILRTQITETVDKVNDQLSEVPSPQPYINSFLNTVDKAVSEVKEQLSVSYEKIKDATETVDKELSIRNKVMSLKDSLKLETREESSSYDKPTPPKNVSQGNNTDDYIIITNNMFATIKSRIWSFFAGTEPVVEKASSEILNMLKEPSEDEDEETDVDYDD